MQVLISINMVLQMAKRNLHFHSCYFETYFLCELLIMKARWKDILHIFIHSYKYMWVIYRIEKQLELSASQFTHMVTNCILLFDSHCSFIYSHCSLKCCPSQNCFMERFLFFPFSELGHWWCKVKLGHCPCLP